MNTAEAAKFNMVEQQMRPWEILDPAVIHVIKSLDRADFVRDDYKGLAYADCRIPCGNDAQMLPPTIEGRLLQALMIEPSDTVLEIGSGSGYVTACLASLGKQVLSIDIDGENLDFARQNVANAGLSNVEFKAADGLNCEYQECYDVIAVTGSVSEIPDNLKQSLSHGGRMFIVEGRSPAMQAMLITRIGDTEWTTLSLFETDLAALQS
ncbi:MAG: protein-L-isoaspartate O-methyltransferase [Gammaproteobacteria bacterium]|nr:protein-L-isoaspartate O-methyltransferase [Gammaproteobacteria bacterium]